MGEGRIADSNFRQQRLFLQKRVEERQDRISGLLTEEAARTDITRELQKIARYDTCAMFVIEFERPEPNDSVPEAGPGKESTAAEGKMLASFFRTTDVVARVDDEKYLAFMCGAISRNTVVNKAGLICQNMQFSDRLDPERGRTVYVGAYLSSGRNGVTYEQLYREAQAALLMAKSGRGGNFCVNTDVSGQNRKKIAEYFQSSTVSVLPALLDCINGGVCLLEVGKQIRVIYASAGFYEMLQLEKDDFCFPCTLAEAGVHMSDIPEYESLLRRGVESGQTISHVHRIFGKQKGYRWIRTRAVYLTYMEAAFPVMLEIVEDITELVDKEYLLSESKERLRIACEHSPKILWEVDIRSKNFKIYDTDMSFYTDEKGLDNFPEVLFDNGIIHPDSVDNFRIFAETILRGEKGGSGNFITKNERSGRYEWCSMSYHMVCDRNGKPVKAIGVRMKLPNIPGMTSRIYQRRPLPEVVRHHYLCRIYVDLTENRIEELFMEGINRTEEVRDIPYSEILENGENRMFIRGEGHEFLERFRIDSLLEDFRRGERWSSRTHRWVDAGGKIRWMRDTVNLQCIEETGHVYLFANFVDDARRKRWEKLLNENVEYDRSGGLYTRQTARSMIEKILQQKKEGLCAMAVISLVGTLGKEEKGITVKQKQSFIGTALNLAMGADCILSIYNGSTILAFCPECDSEFEIKRRIEDAFAYIRVTMTDIPGIERLRFIAGVITRPADKADYDTMVLRGTYLCNIWRNSAVDMVAFPNRESDEKAMGQLMTGPHNISEKEGDSGELSKRGQKAAFDCIAALLMADSIGAAIRNVLRRTGQYYQADRVYILILSENKEEIILPYEWMREGKDSIQNVVQGSKVDAMPVLKQCMERRMTLFLEKDYENLDKKDRRWTYIAYPLQSESQFFGFFCVENPRNDSVSDALLKTVIPYVMREYRRFQDRMDMKEYARVEVMNSLPNLRDYEKRIASMNSDLYSSMGALTVDVPDYSLINSSSGFAYGRDILAYIIEALDNIFGKTFLFRVWDAEFVVLLPDTIQSVFTTRCQRLRGRIQKRYPGVIRMGYTWSDGIFNAKQLVRDARTIMKCAEVSNTSEKGSRFPGKRNFLDEVSVPIKKYVPYFQPKIDMRDGSLIGAEALVRGIDENGNLVMPDKFIETLEKSGEIRNLDFFMLENVLKQMEQWQQKGCPPVNISVNISRKTLFNPTALASVIAIESRYPESLSGPIELEITETACNVEKATLEEVVNQFRKFNVQFGLDDFGSRYANMSIFSNIRFRTIKLDRSLIDDLPANEISKMMVANIAGICKNFGMYCIAEGVETQQQVAELLKAGCCYGQGFYYSKPLPSWKFEEKYLRGEKRK